MKKVMMMMFLFAFCLAGTNAAPSKANEELIGDWKYEVTNAPYGYEKGTLTFAEKNGKLTGEVKFADGYKIELKEVSYEAGKLQCGLYVDYNYVSIKAKVKGEKITGVVDTPEGEMMLTAEKLKKSKE